MSPLDKALRSTVFDVPISTDTTTTVSKLALLTRVESLSFSTLHVLRNVQRCINAALADVPAHYAPVVDIRRGVDNAIRELEVLEQPTAGGSAGFLAGKNPALRMLSRLPVNPPEGLLPTIGNLLLSGWLTQIPLSRHRCDTLSALCSASLDGPTLSEKHKEALRSVLQRSQEDLLDTFSQLAHTQDPAILGFNSLLINHLRSDLSSHHPDLQRDADLRRFLDGSALLQAVSKQMRQMVDGESDAFFALLGFSLHLPVTLLRQVPLCNAERCDGRIFWLNPISGIAHLDLRPLLRNLGRPIPGCESANDTIRLPLPKVLADHLHIAAASRPSARCVGELVDAPVRESSAVDRYWNDANLAKLIRSGPSVGIRQSSGRMVVAYGFLAFFLIDHSDLPYVSVSEEQIWQARAKVFAATGLGPLVSVGTASSVRVGSARNASAETVCAIFKEFDDAVENARVGRRYNLLPLVEFHNALARRVGLYLHFISGGRASEFVSFPASSWFEGALFGYLDDKESGISGGRTPIPVTPMVSLQLRLWRLHLESLKSRLVKQLGVRARNAVEHIDAVVQRRPVPAVFSLDPSGVPELIRVEQLFDGPAEALNRDWGRHFFASGLTALDQPLSDLHLFLRHQGGGINPQSSLGIETLADPLHRIAVQIDSILRDLKVMPLAGLVGERA